MVDYRWWRCVICCLAMVYATRIFRFYIAMVLTLMALFFRPVGFDYRSKLENSRWRSSWDWCLFIGGFVLQPSSVWRLVTCCKVYHSALIA